MSEKTIQDTRNKRVLIIEDEGDMCLLLNILLNGKELELDHVKTLKAAKEYLRDSKPDVILLDNKMPDGFGVDFLSFLKENYPSSRVILISGFDPSVSDVALENGADGFLEKPFTREQLYQAIKKLLN